VIQKTRKPVQEGSDVEEEQEVEDEEEKEVVAVGNVPDLLADSKVWQWAGVNFGDYDTLLL
jgi:radial spoke head protein 4A